MCILHYFKYSCQHGEDSPLQCNWTRDYSQPTNVVCPETEVFRKQFTDVQCASCRGSKPIPGVTWLTTTAARNIALNTPNLSKQQPYLPDGTILPWPQNPPDRSPSPNHGRPSTSRPLPQSARTVDERARRSNFPLPDNSIHQFHHRHAVTDPHAGLPQHSGQSLLPVEQRTQGKLESHYQFINRMIGLGVPPQHMVYYSGPSAAGEFPELPDGLAAPLRSPFRKETKQGWVQRATDFGLDYKDIHRIWRAYSKTA